VVNELTQTPAAIAGYKLLYLVGERVYEYHTDTTSTVLMCGQANLYDERPELFLQLDPVAAELGRLAVERVASDLDLPQTRIDLISVRPMTWDDASLGCPLRGEFYAQLPVQGYQLVLVAGGRQYVFHSNEDRLVLCKGGITPTPTFTYTRTPTFTPTPSETLTPTITRTRTPTNTRTPTSTRTLITTRTPIPPSATSLPVIATATETSAPTTAAP
jgi:hypothetical protein